MQYLSKNFKLEEFLKNDEGIKIVPTSKQLDNLKVLAKTIMQPIRDYVGSPILITSGLRTEEINSAVGGSPKSLHLTGRACDFTTYKKPALLLDVFLYIHRNLDVEECILYLHNKNDKRFIHIATGKENRFFINYNNKLYNMDKWLEMDI